MNLNLSITENQVEIIKKHIKEQNFQQYVDGTVHLLNI
jgi:hypothetical protein